MIRENWLVWGKIGSRHDPVGPNYQRFWVFKTQSGILIFSSDQLFSGFLEPCTWLWSNYQGLLKKKKKKKRWPRWGAFNEYSKICFLWRMKCPTFANSADSKGANWSGSGSGSALFITEYMNLQQQSGSSNLIGWKLEVGVASYFIQHDKG